MGRSLVNEADRKRHIGTLFLPGVNAGAKTAMRKRAVNGPVVKSVHGNAGKLSVSDPSLLISHNGPEAKWRLRER
jgi:hypothetical protein